MAAAGTDSLRRGFTLVEMMLAMTIFLIASTGLLSLLVNSLEASRQTQLRSQARQVSGQVMAELQVLEYGALPALDGRATSHGLIMVERTVETDQPVAGQTRLTVTARWRQRERLRSLRLQAWRAEP